MRPLIESEIRASFVNASESDLARLVVPDLRAIEWADRDFLGWIDPSSPQRGCMVMDYADDVVGLVLRVPGPSSGRVRGSMCNLCHTIHGRGGVRLMTAPRAGKAGLAHNMVGTYMCADLDCSLYVRGLKTLEHAQIPEIPSNVPFRVRRLNRRLNDFVARVLAPQPEHALEG